jgi:hypothetical protein
MITGTATIMGITITTTMISVELDLVRWRRHGLGALPLPIWGEGWGEGVPAAPESRP